ncbi:MAG: hypothetical protein L6R37_003569 [Teloschistes peruensis]|nr:MAG: hypothetical protein L6R37_003569 [Teloschistes peruensis]
MASNGKCNQEKEQPEDAYSSEPEDLALSVSSEGTIIEESPKHLSALWLLESQVISPHPLYTVDEAGTEIKQFEELQHVAAAIHAQQAHDLDSLQSALQDNPSQSSSLARAHLSPLNIKTHVAGMPRRIAPAPAPVPAPGAAREHHATRRRRQGAAVLAPAPSTRPINHVSNAPEVTYVAGTTFPLAAQSTRVNPVYGPAFPPPSFGLAAPPIFQGPVTAPFIGAQPVPGPFFGPGPAFQQSAQFQNRSPAPHYGGITLVPRPQPEGVPPGQVLPWFNPPADRTRDAPVTRRARIKHSAHPKSPLNRFSIDIPKALNAALPFPFPSNVYAPPHTYSNPPHNLTFPQNFVTAPWVPEPDAHFLDSNEAFRQINTHRNLCLGFGEIAEKLKAVGHPAATERNVKAIWERRVADRADPWRTNPGKGFMFEMGEDAFD